MDQRPDFHMKHLFLAWAAMTATMLVVDLLWLGVLAKPLYQQGIGHLMAEQPRLGAAALFYALYPLGVLLFVLVLPAHQGEWLRVAWIGAAFGFFAYATYDLTNLATLRGWPWRLAAIDMAWGSLLTAVMSMAGLAVWKAARPLQ